MFHTRCTECGEVLKADRNQRGMKVRCPHCGKKFRARALGWWDKVTHEGASKAEAVKHAPPRKKIRHGAGVHRPYEKIDESVLEEIPTHHTSGVTIVAAILILIVVGMTIAWLATRGEQPQESAAGRQPADQPEEVMDTASVGDLPTEADVEPPPEPEPTDILPDTTTGGGGSGLRLGDTTKTGLPEQAYEMDIHMRSAGYRMTRGEIALDGIRYFCGVAGYPDIAVVAFPHKNRIICRLTILHRGLENPDVARFDAEKEVLCDVMKVYIEADRQAMFRQWFSSAMAAAANACEEDEPYFVECSFRDRVVCVEATRVDWRNGVRVELARSFRPSTEVAGLQPVRSWEDIREGVTLSEIQQFAGHAERVSVSGAGEWKRETYVWPDGGRVTFQNGRAVKWRAP